MSSNNGRRATPGSYSSLAGFYRADARRINSRELDVGLWWRESIDGPLHRAAWVSDTGELYLARLGPSVEDVPSVELLAVVDDHERLESALAGWRERCGQPRSLSWLRERTARLGPRERTHARTGGRLRHSSSGVSSLASVGS